MSIAATEAERLYPPQGPKRASLNNMSIRWITIYPNEFDAYLKGRLAKPTNSEIEAVAKALYTSKAWNRLDEIIPRWEDQSPEVKGNYMMNAESLLKVARKAVMA
jgi:hypothetical protein